MYLMPALRAVLADSTEEKICVSEIALDGTGCSVSLEQATKAAREISAM